MEKEANIMVAPTRNTASSLNRSRSGSGSGASPYQQPKLQHVRTGPLLVGCILLIVIPLSVLNIVNTTKTLTSTSTSMMLDYDQPIHEDWNQDKNQKGEPSSSVYKGQSWVQHRGNGKNRIILAAETESAKCEVHQHHGKDHIVMEEQDIIHVAVVDTKNRFWILHHNKHNQNHESEGMDETPYFATPITTIAYSPVTGYTSTSTEAPWYAAQRIVAQVIGILPTSTKVVKSSEHVLLDENGIKDGGLPTSSPGEQQQPTRNDHNQQQQLDGQPRLDWKFLGRHRTMAERGGGFVYSYLLRNVPGSPEDTGAPQETIALSREEVEEALIQGRFADVRGIATISLALLQQDK